MNRTRFTICERKANCFNLQRIALPPRPLRVSQVDRQFLKVEANVRAPEAWLLLYQKPHHTLDFQQTTLLLSFLIPPFIEMD